MEDRCHAVGRDHAMALCSFDGGPQRSGDISVGRTIEDDVPLKAVMVHGMAEPPPSTFQP